MSEKIRVCPSMVCNSGILNIYTAVAMGSLMYVAGMNGVECREFHVFDQHPISNARNTAVSDFLSDKTSTHIFFLDSDVIPPVNVIPKLLGHNKLVVSGWYNFRGNQLPSVMKQTKLGWVNYSQQEMVKALQNEQLIPIDGGGAGCLLIAREVFESISKPYFLESADGKGVGEDLYFSENCKQHGIQPYLDPSIFCRHFHWVLL